MFRRLTAIEIAEGALLADVAVVFHFVARFLPGSASFLSLLICTIFTLLVLRRGLYVSLMGMCVTAFLVSVLTGPNGLFTLSAECLGGIFLGETMRRRWSPWMVAFIGAVTGSLYLYCDIILLSLLTGISINDYLPSLQRSIHLGLNIIDLVTAKVGLSLFWQQMQPQVLVVLTWMLSYWYITLYLGFVVVLCPVVLIIYTFVSSMVRILGCDVRPFPGASVNRLIRRWRHSVLRAIARRRQVQRAQTGRTRRLHKREGRWRKVA